MNLKRNNWTNKEIINLVKGLIPLNEDGSEVTEITEIRNYTLGIIQVQCLFEDFERELNDYSAKGVNPETGEIFAIGPKLPQ